MEAALMVVDQLDGFLGCAVYWENPAWVDMLSRLYIYHAVTIILKRMLKKVQSTSVKNSLH